MTLAAPATLPDGVEILRPNRFQTRVLEVPEDVDLFLGGGRGGGKSHLLAFLAVRHLAVYPKRARVFCLQKTFASLHDFEWLTRDLVPDGSSGSIP